MHTTSRGNRRDELENGVWRTRQLYLREGPAEAWTLIPMCELAVSQGHTYVKIKLARPK